MNHSPGISWRAMVVALSLLPAACGYSDAAMQVQRGQVTSLRGELERTRAERASLTEQVRGLESRNGVLTSAVNELGGHVERLEQNLRGVGADVESLERDRTSLRANLGEAREALDAMRAREAQAQARATLFRSMLERFRSMIAAGQLSVRVVRNRIVIALPEAVLFDSGRAEIKADGRRALDQVSAVLRTLDRDFQVVGHTDNVPIHNARFASNWELSTARATQVVHFLMEDGMPADRISASGFADAQPVAANDTPASRQLNRRIEIVLLPALSEMPDLTPLQSVGAEPAPAAPPAAPPVTTP